MKLLLTTVAFALFAPIATCISINPVISSSVQLPTKSSPSPKTATASVTKDWYKYAAKDGSYTTMFPSQPLEENGSFTLHLGENKIAAKFVVVGYFDNTNNRAYATAITKFAVNPNKFNVKKLLDGVRDGQARGANMTICGA
jgi:hypothetical protein